MLKYFAPGLFYLLLIFMFFVFLKFLYFKFYERKIINALKKSHKEIIDFERKE